MVDGAWRGGGNPESEGQCGRRVGNRVDVHTWPAPGALNDERNTANQKFGLLFSYFSNRQGKISEKEEKDRNTPTNECDENRR